MTTKNNLINQASQPVPLVKPILVGAGIALLVILFFITGADETHPEWGKYRMVRPLLITPIAGAIGGAFYAFMDYQRTCGLNRFLAIFLSLVVYLIGLWLGIVLGLDGTMWD